MKYVALVYYQESLIEAMSEQEWHDLNQQCLACVDRLTEAGHYIAGEALQPIATATTVRVREGETLLTDGPLCRNQGATRRLLPAGSPQPGRGATARQSHSPGTPGQRRSPPRAGTTTPGLTHPYRQSGVKHELR